MVGNTGRTHRRAAVLACLTVLAGTVLTHGQASASRTLATADSHSGAVAVSDTAVFAGGCFWGVQWVFQHVKGVVTATSGYTGGWTDKASHRAVNSGRTGHAESVRVVFDPARVSYAKLLEIFFTVAHDPTQLNRQGPDVGTQYRSALFYLSAAQKKTAESYIDMLNKSHVFSKSIVTQVAPYKEFVAAEMSHQGYSARNPRDRYVVINDVPRVQALKARFPVFWSESLADWK